jgi:hypothetical protein
MAGLTMPSEEKAMRRLMCGLVVMLAFGCAAALTAAGPSDGKWTARVIRPAPATPQDLTITLASDQGGKVTGSVAIQGGMESPIEWGFVKGDLVTFKVKMPFNDQVVPFVYIGTVQGATISFGRRPEDLSLGRLVEFTANKAN